MLNVKLHKPGVSLCLHGKKVLLIVLPELTTNNLSYRHCDKCDLIREIIYVASYVYVGPVPSPEVFDQAKLCYDEYSQQF